ncbi:MAG: hotdog fold domain-containing protein [Acidaminococcaceae bacterium]
MVPKEEYTWCFACGKDNPIGLKLEFKVDENGCYTTFIPQREHQSYDGRMHGGLISTLLDETMGNYIHLYEKKIAYTAKMEVRFRQPVFIGEKIQVIAQVKKRKGRLIEMTGKIMNRDGSIAAEADAKMIYEGE